MKRIKQVLSIVLVLGMVMAFVPYGLAIGTTEIFSRDIDLVEYPEDVSAYVVFDKVGNITVEISNVTSYYENKNMHPDSDEFVLTELHVVVAGPASLKIINLECDDPVLYGKEIDLSIPHYPIEIIDGYADVNRHDYPVDYPYPQEPLTMKQGETFELKEGVRYYFADLYDFNEKFIYFDIRIHVFEGSIAEDISIYGSPFREEYAYSPVILEYAPGNTITDTKVTPIPANPTTGSTAMLKSTAGLVNVIPPSPITVTESINYKTVKGDSLSAIAKKYNTTADAIKAANKAYFDDLAERNAKQKTKVALEAGVNLNIRVTETKDLAYTVQKGEALWGIAFNYYGNMSGSTIKMIKDANAAYFKKTNGILEAGAVIILPGKGLISPVTQGSLSEAAGMYLVKAGDTLSDIAKAYYGDSKYWTKIYEANKDRIKMVGNSPIIYEKQWLVIPE